MTINIHSIHFHVDNNLQDFIEKKINKLLKLDKKIISTDVFLKFSKADSYSNKIAEIKLKYPGSKFFAKRQTDTFEESTMQVLQALRKQILKNKAKK
ncbi:MAG: ribosomal subunit interface protein [Flavobacteriales bacterium TMED123]|nr:MAG: ribosomal subunit interface protein [Flavobacteriales bacterium TMED123]|tara:strand:- start:176 stop:466 length:291 start_codon:yes stop_codon:yes gene_type:complete